MEEQISLSEASQATCAVCNKQVNSEDSFCESCGYPLKGTEQEQNYFIATRGNKEIDLEEANKKIASAGKALYWVAGLTLVAGLAYFFILKVVAVLIVNIILAGIYLGLGFWSKSKPLAAIISGLSLYVLTYILNGIVDPITLAQGIIIKIVMVGLLIKGIKSALEAEKLKKELNVE